MFRRCLVFFQESLNKNRLSGDSPERKSLEGPLEIGFFFFFFVFHVA